MMQYLKNIQAACVTIFDGMAVTFSHLFRTPITVQYPDKTPVPVIDTLPERYRGHLHVDMDICISCRACERACPIECIRIDDVRIPRDSVVGVNGKESARVKEPTRFDILLYKCMYCGLCVEPCPTGAIRHTKEFEGSGPDLERYHLRFVDEERRQAVLRKADVYEKEQAEKKRLKEEAESTGSPPAEKPDPEGAEPQGEEE